ncbi:class I SAM-dependent methyltransferase [Nocardioides sp. zg-1308]|uniref:class I SAM-dependent methyltransferase n=1 Tax=Nocardioides sp. zg-1308 TaxID=2736253 RepID=UPI001551DB43|nr:class I SAM-dependent methyltransferase [Nocardioides sp. zg-1308]NPD03624.1 class I SAM-dependent methyltransferase [Nocardioides sp. zg-1308]
MTDLSSEQLAERLFGSLLGTIDVLSVYLGDRLGWYRSLVDDGPASAPTLAERTGTDARYAREWLEQQAVTGYLTVDQDGGPDERMFSIPPATAEVMTDTASVNHLAPFARMFAATGPTLPQLVEAYRTGGGVSWEQLGADARESQADGNRPWFDSRLAPALADVPRVHEVLSRPGATVLDVGAGGGWSTIALARAYPEADVSGIDIDRPSVELARANAAAAGVAVDFRHGDAADLAPGSYDVAFAFECVHDMPAPVEVLSAVRRALAPGGCLVVMDEAVAETFAPDGDELERLMYGFSLLICLPDGLSRRPSAGTGTVMRPAVLKAYASEARFTDMEVLPIEDFGFWRFYLLR